jgi:hypothetical protein
MTQLSVGGVWSHLAKRQPDLRVASLRRRFLASLINLLVGLLLVVVAVGAVVGMFRVAAKWRINFKPLRGLGSADPNTLAQLQSRRIQFILHGVAFAGSVLSKERRSPGFRLLGLRRVDARTAGDVSRGQEIIRAAARQAWRILCRRFLPSPKTRASPELEKLESDLQDAHRRYANDQAALQLEIMRIYQENKVAPMRTSCLPVFAHSLLSTGSIYRCSGLPRDSRSWTASPGP